MRVGFVYVALLVWILSPVAIPADEREQSASGGGITTKKIGDKPQSPSSTDPRDRRWITRTHPPDLKKVKKAPAKLVNWKNSTQKKRCENDLEKLDTAFFKARYYAIQGDSRACAENADQFLGIYEIIRKACPANYLENEGYSCRITRNMGWLKELGERRSMGPNVVPGVQPELKPELKTDQIPDTSPKGLGKK